MALNHKSSASLINPWKIKVQIIRMFKEDNQESCLVLLESSGTRIHTTIDETFSNWTRKIGNEKINKPNDEEIEIEIEIAEDIMINKCKNPIETIVKQLYGDTYAQSYNPNKCQDKSILCHTNEEVDQINDYMLSKISGEEKTYLSADTISPEYATPNDYMLYPMELLNIIDVPGLPKHSLKLKVGTPVMLLRDIDPYRGLRNGTRLVITRLGNFVLEAKVLTPNNDGEKVFFPRMYAVPSDPSFPIKMRRKQYPLKVAFAMTINKSQGKRLFKVGLFLPRQVSSSRGGMYVAISKVMSKDGLKVLIANQDEKPNEETANVVFKDMFQNV